MIGEETGWKNSYWTSEDSRLANLSVCALLWILERTVCWGPDLQPVAFLGDSREYGRRKPTEWKPDHWEKKEPSSKVLFSFLCLLPNCYERSMVHATHISHRVVLCHHRLRNNMSIDCGSNPLWQWTKISLLSFKSIISAILTQWKTNTSTKLVDTVTDITRLHESPKLFLTSYRLSNTS